MSDDLPDLPDILNCPCCGGPPQYAQGINGLRIQVYVYCCHCPMRTEIVGSYEAAAGGWNKRPMHLDAARAAVAAADAYTERTKNTSAMSGVVERRYLREALAEVDRLTARLAAAEACASILAKCDDADFCVCGMPEGQRLIREWRKVKV